MDKNHDDFNGFTINLFLDEDGDYLAHFVEMPNVSAFSETPEGALRELAVAWKCVKECYEEDQEPIPQAPSREGYAGPFNVPVDAQFYHALSNEAAKAGDEPLRTCSTEIEIDRTCCSRRVGLTQLVHKSP